MSDKLEKNYRSFRVYMCNAMYWMNEDEKKEKDENKKEELKREQKERKEVLDKLESIRSGRHLALVGGTNEEKMLYEKIIPLINEKYEGTNSIDNKRDEELYKTIKEMVDTYQMDKKDGREMEDEEKDR